MAIHTMQEKIADLRKRTSEAMLGGGDGHGWKSSTRAAS